MPSRKCVFTLFLAGGLPHPGTSRKRVEKDGVSDVRPRLQRAAPSRQPDETVARRGARPRYCRCHLSARAAPELVLRCVRLRLAGGRAAAVTPDVAATSRLPDGSPMVSAHRTGRPTPAELLSCLPRTSESRVRFPQDVQERVRLGGDSRRRTVGTRIATTSCMTTARSFG